jgi:Tat protein secretion system quality control protein TatD with DNase activity
VVEKMAELLNEDIQTIQTLTSNNAQTLFKEFSSLNSLK